MINIQVDKRIGDFLDKWRQAFRTDDDLMLKNQKTEAFFIEAEELRIFLLEKNGELALNYALRVMAAIPGLTSGLRQVFKKEQV